MTDMKEHQSWIQVNSIFESTFNRWQTYDTLCEYTTYKLIRGTHTAKVFIQQLHISVDDLQGDELIVLVLDGTAEVQTGVSVTQQCDS